MTKEELLMMLTKTDDSIDEEELAEQEDHIKVDHVMWETFLNGFIIFKRGK